MSPKRKDASIAKLNDLGYNVIRVPRTGISPLDLLAHDKTQPQLGRIGTLSTFWHGDLPVPMPGPPNAAVSLNNTHSSNLDLGFGLDLLKGALAVFGASAPSIDLSHTQAKSLQFNYANVTTVSIDSGVIGDYLTDGTLAVANPATRRWILDPGSEVYVITEVLRSTSITVTAADEQGNGVELKVPEIHGLAGANVNVKPSSATNTAITFESATIPPTAANFGFKAIRLKWTPAADGAAGKGIWDFEDAGNISFGVAPTAGGNVEGTSGAVVFDTGTESCLLDI